MKKLVLAAVLLVPVCVFAQNTGTGLPPFGSFTSGGLDTVNNQNLNVYFGIPIVSSAGRGMPLSLSLVNNSLIWRPVSNSWMPVTGGWQMDFPPGGMASYTSTTNTVKCYDNPPSFFWAQVTYYNGFIYTDVLGTRHSFSVNFRASDSCLSQNSGAMTGHASDSTGYYLSVSLLDQFTPTLQVTTPGGILAVNGNGSATDTNGNYITKTVVSSTETDWTDSVGNVALKIIYTPNQTSPTSIQYQFLDGAGASSYKTITLKLQSFNIKTAFGCSVGEYNGTAYLPYEMDIPSPNTGTLVYTFTYEPTPQNSGYYTGRLQKVVLPAGGSYEYDYTGSNDGINCSDGTTLGMNRKVSDGTNTATWNFVRNTSNGTTTVTTPQLADTPNANDTVYTFNSSGRETGRQIYKESPGVNVLRTVNTTWATNGTPATQVTILEDGSTQSETDTSFDSNGLLDSVTEYDWGTNTHGSLLRTTTMSYQTSTNYTSRNIINLVTSKVLKDGQNVVQYRQDTTYDGVALVNCPTGAAQHDDTAYPCSMNYRGNPTAVTTYLTPGTPANGVTKNFTYDWFGNLLTAQLNCCQNKTWTYSASTQYSQPDRVTRGSSPTQLTTSAMYNAYTGQVSSTTDENGQITNYSYDFLRRPTSVVRNADGATLTYTYDDVHFTATTKSPIDSTKSVQQVTAVDGLGRVIQSTTEDGNGTPYSIVSAQYDLLGRAYKTSNPYTGTSASYWTTTAFDVLGRPTSVTLPDSSATTYSYAAQTVTLTDPAGKKRKSQADAAGRLVTVTEPDSSNNLTQDTSYTYTVLGALATVTQPSQTRTYSYDALGRLTSVATPETKNGTVQGTISYTYDTFDNLLTRTDARGVITNYTPDGLNRLTQVSYNVGTTGVAATSTVILTYGTSAAQNNNGRLITMTDGVGSENYTYNNLGQVTQLQKVIGTTTYTINFGYNTAGEMKQITYPSGRVVQQSFDPIGRLCEIAPSTTGCSTASSPYATGYGYNMFQLTGFNYGNGVAATFGYSADRLQLTSLSYAKGATTLYSLNYVYGSAGSNNGQITGITDNVDNGRSVTYTYDPLARLFTAVTTGSTAYPKWGLSMTYDRYGNRSAQSISAGCVYPMTCPTNSVTIDTTSNRITGSPYAYDANGNMTNDGNNTLVYDGENRAVSSTTNGTISTYTYDGNGLRVQKQVGSATATVYIFSGTKVIAEYASGAAVGSPTKEYIYSGSALLATIAGSTTTYHHADHLSVRVTTDSSGNALGQQGHYPFGEQWYPVPPQNPATKWQFTSYERDGGTNESGNDYAMTRYNVNRLGRFATPDPVAGSIADPQSLNRYAYVGNDPTDLSDPSGLCPGGPDPLYIANLKNGLGHTVCTSAHGPSEITVLKTIYWFSSGVVAWDEDGLFWGNYLAGVFLLLGPPDTGDPGGGGGVSDGYCANKNAVNFVKSHKADAQPIASRLGVPVQFVLAVSANESQYGTYPTAVAANNYFGIHTGPVAIANGSTGPYADNPIFAAWTPGTNGFLGSGNAFASIAERDKASGVTDPKTFFTDIHAQFGVGTANYVTTMLQVLAAVTARLNCP